MISPKPERSGKGVSQKTRTTCLTFDDLCNRARQGLGVIVIAAVALLAVVQHQLSGQLSGRFQHDETLEIVAVEDAADNHYSGLVGLSLTYALPIVGEHAVFACFLLSHIVGKECVSFDNEARDCENSPQGHRSPFCNDACGQQRENNVSVFTLRATATAGAPMFLRTGGCSNAPLTRGGTRQSNGSRPDG